MDLYTRILITFGICNLFALGIIIFCYFIFKIKNEIVNYNRMIKTLNGCLLEINKKPYITFRIIEKSYMRKYINLGIDVKEEGIADILMGYNHLNQIKNELEGMAIVIKSIYKYNMKISFI